MKDEKMKGKSCVEKNVEWNEINEESSWIENKTFGGRKKRKGSWKERVFSLE